MDDQYSVPTQTLDQNRPSVPSYEDGYCHTCAGCGTVFADERGQTCRTCEGSGRQQPGGDAFPTADARFRWCEG